MNTKQRARFVNEHPTKRNAMPNRKASEVEWYAIPRSGEAGCAVYKNGFPVFAGSFEEVASWLVRL